MSFGFAFCIAVYKKDIETLRNILDNGFRDELVSFNIYTFYNKQPSELLDIYLSLGILNQEHLNRLLVQACCYSPKFVRICLKYGAEISRDLFIKNVEEQRANIVKCFLTYGYVDIQTKQWFKSQHFNQKKMNQNKYLTFV